MLSPERQEALLITTPKAYTLSLSPPRSPPFDSAQRALLMGHDPSKFPLIKVQPSILQHQPKKEDSVNHESNPYLADPWIRYILQRSYQQQTKWNKTMRHPHLLNNRDTFTLWLDQNLSVSTFNKLRDGG
jgi:hypothetical protein